VSVSALAQKSLYARSHAPPPSHWASSTSATAAHVLTPLLTASTLGAVLVWAVAAAILPLIRVRRPTAVDLVAISAWATGLAVALSVAGPPILAGEVALGAIAAVALTLAPDVTRRLARPTLGGDLRSMELR
jgi:hypothetical protein